MWLLRANKCIQAVHIANGILGVNNYDGPSSEVGRSETLAVQQVNVASRPKPEDQVTETPASKPTSRA